MANKNKDVNINEDAGHDALGTTKKKRNMFSSKKFRRGGFSVAVTVIFIAAVVLINVIINTLLSRFDVRLDLSERGLYSIEQSTADFLGNLDDTIHFYFCSNEEAYRSLSDYFPQVIEIVNRFTESNRSFTITFIDRLSNPGFSSQYGGDLRDSDIVIVSENTGRFRVVTSSDYMVVDFVLQGQRLSQEEAMQLAQFGAPVDIDISSGAEQAFLSAIMSVSDTSPVRVAFTAGFGEGVVTTTAGESILYAPMAALLEKNSYLIETVDLFSASVIDPEIDYLIIFTPTFDYSMQAIETIDAWLDNEGMHGKTLLYFPTARNDIRSTPNLDAFLAEWGIRVEPGYVLQSNNNFASAGSDGLEQMVNHAGLFSEGVDTPLVGYFIRPLTALFERQASFMTNVFLQGFPGTMFFPFEAMNDELDGEELAALFGGLEVMDMGIMSTKLRYHNMDELTSRIIAFGSPYFFTHVYLEAEHFGNAHLLLNIFNVLSGRDENRVFIMPKSFTMTRFEITAAQANGISMVFVIILPLVIIALGLVVYFRRRYK
jgi:hypothetical protein